MNTIIITAAALKAGQMICENNGMCFEIIEVKENGKKIEIILDGSYSLTHHGLNFHIALNINQKVAVWKEATNSGF
jgi:hypothetical protein